MRKRILTIIIALSIFVVPTNAYAKTSEEIQAEIEPVQAEIEMAEAKIDSASAELNRIEKERDDILYKQQVLMEQKNDLKAEISELEYETDALENPTLGEIISDTGSRFMGFFAFASDGSGEDYLTRAEQIENNKDEIKSLQDNLNTIMVVLDQHTQSITELALEQTGLDERLDLLYDEYDETCEKEVALEEELATAKEEERIAAEEEKRKVEEEEKRIAEEAEKQEEEENISWVPEATSGTYDMPSGDGILTWSGGINYYNGHMETWYTMREWTGDLGIPGMYIGVDGIVRDCDGYICVASDDDPKGTIVDTSLGVGKVYDCGPGHGIIDIYTDWPLY